MSLRLHSIELRLLLLCLNRPKDFTIKRPTSELSREEVHEQILQLQKEIRARAIAGEFSDEKINKMRRYMDGTDPDKTFDPDADVHAWSKLHPGVDDDEDIEEE